MMNAELELAHRYVEQTGTSLFLTGKAGTGKTTFLRDIDAHCPKRHVVVAPTGVAAVNAGGVTIHSFFQLPFDPYLPEVPELVTEYQMPSSHKSFSKNKLTLIRTLELLIIDEISMVRADLLDAVDMTLRRVRRSSLPFGGVQLLMIGDVHQLPPVVTEREAPFMRRVYPSPFFFHSKALARVDYVTIELTTVYRQQDWVFVEILNRVRTNRLDEATLGRLNERVSTSGGRKSEVGGRRSTSIPITLTTHNRQADDINRDHMQKLRGESRTFEARVDGNFPESMMPVDSTLEVKVGERVMFVKNDSSGLRRYYNGKLATVTGFTVDDEAELVEVIDDDGEVVNVGRELWENVKYNLNPRSGDIEQAVDGTFRQYPLRPAWAVTIHKAQGLTFDRVNIDAAEAFAFGQVYVALSRCRTLEGLSLATPLSPAVTFADEDVQRFCDAQASFDQVQHRVAEDEQRYYYSQLADLFGMQALTDDFEHLLDVYSLLKNIYPEQLADLKALSGKVADLASVAERFNIQLLRLPRDAHADRIAKGAAYYLGQLRPCAEALAPLLDIEVDNQDTARRLRQAGETLVDRLNAKIACLAAVEKHGFDVRTVAQAMNAYVVRKSEVGGRKSESKILRPQPSDLRNKLNSGVAEKLRKWRKEKAAEMGVRPFLIFDQRTLMALATSMPATEEELQAVPGMGKKRIALYGKEIIELIRNSELK